MKVFITNNKYLSDHVTNTKDIHIKLFNLVTSSISTDVIPLNPEIPVNQHKCLLFELKGLKNNILYYEFLGLV